MASRPKLKPWIDTEVKAENFPRENVPICMFTESGAALMSYSASSLMVTQPDFHLWAS